MPSGFDKNDFIIDTRATGVEETKKQLDSVGTVLEKLDKQTQSMRITFGRMTAGLGKNMDQLSNSFSSLGKTISSAFSKQTQTIGNYIVTGSPYSKGELHDLSNFRKELQSVMNQRGMYSTRQKKQLRQYNSLLAKSRAKELAFFAEQQRTASQTVWQRLVDGIASVGRELDKNTQKIKAQRKEQNSLTKSLRNTVLAFMSIRSVARFVSQAIQTSASFTENLNLFAVTFNREYEDTLDWTLELADNLGLSVNEVIRMTGLFKQLSSAIGITGEQGTELAKTFTRLSYDWASFYNYQVDEVYSKIQAGIFSGQVRTLRTMGIDVSMESVDSLIRYNEELRNLGISSRSLNQEQKVLARTILALDASINALGNMTAEIDTLENRIRVLKSSWENFKLAVGDIFYEPFRQGLAYINGFMQALTTAIRAFVPYREEMEDTDRVLNAFVEDYIESHKILHEAEGLDWNELLEEQYREEAIKAYDDGMREIEESFNRVNNLSFDKFESLSVGESLTQTEKEKAISEALNKILQDKLGICAQLSDYTHRIDEETLSIRENILGWIFPDFKGFEGSFGDFIKEFGTLNKETGEYELRAENLNKALQSVIQAFKILKDTIGPFLTALLSISPITVEAISSFVRLISNIIILLDKLGLLESIVIAFFTMKLALGVLSVLTAISKLSTGVKGLSLSLKGVETVLGGIVGLIALQLSLDLIKNWDDLSLGAKVLQASLIGLAVGLFAVAVAGASALSAITAGVAGAFIAVSIATAVSAINKAKKSTISGYADGGIPAKSELFYMNEYGVPEALVNTGGSETNVINQQQMIQLTKAGFLEAINESGLLNSQNTRIVLEGRNIDNNSLARGIFPALKIESRNRGGNQL